MLFLLSRSEVERCGDAMAKNTICLWYDKDAEAAARFYAQTFPDSAVVLLRQEIASYGVTVRATLREHFLGETGHERGPAGTVRGLCRGTRRGDWACGSGRAIA